MDKINTDDVDLHKHVHALFCQVFSSLTNRLRSERKVEITHLPHEDAKFAEMGAEVEVEKKLN